jgi:hypothetical protein
LGSGEGAGGDPRPAPLGSGEGADGDPRPAALGSGAGDPQPVPGPGEADSRRPPWRGWEPVIRVAGVVIAILASFVSGVFELLLSTLRAGDVTAVWHGDAIGSGGGPLIGVSILLAAVLNYGIAWFAVSTTGRSWALGPPWALWTLMMLFAAGVRTSEGDYLLGGKNWVALVMILVGSLSYAVYSYRMILKRVPR